MAKGTNVKTGVGGLKYVFITGEGKNQAMPGDPERMQFIASLVCVKGGKVHMQFRDLVLSEWNAYKKQFGVKGVPTSIGIRDEMIDDPSGVIDSVTEKVVRVATGNVLINFKTNTSWSDGKPQVIKVFDRKSKDITEAFNKAPWSIGEGSTGVLHGIAQGNNAGGKDKVTLYLTAVQIAKLVKYEANVVETEEIEGEDIDLGEDDSGDVVVSVNSDVNIWDN